ncbi:MAG: hypothetical protein QW727_02405 [Candidatus Pacearchaeota archaeon]
METKTTEKPIKSYCGGKLRNKGEVYATVYEEFHEPAYFCNPTCLLTFCIDKLMDEIGMEDGKEYDDEEYEIREVGEVLIGHIMTLLDYKYGETCKECFKKLKEVVI